MSLPNRIVKTNETKPVSKADQMADAVFAAVRDYIDRKLDRRFSDLYKYLPSGADHTARTVESITTEVEKMLERHQRTIKDDVEELRAMLMKLETLEQRIELLESRKS